MIRLAGWLVLIGLPLLAHAQQPVKLCKWWVELNDKKGTPYHTNRPAEFLSARAIERRAINGAAILEEDLPVNPAYVNELRNAGYKIHGVSRWMNAVAIIADTATALRITAFPFVKKLTYLGRDIRVKNAPNKPPKKRQPFYASKKAEAQFGYYGYSGINLGPLRSTFLQDLGTRGNGIWVAVMDGGFTHVDTMPFFDSIALTQRLWPGPDFVERDQAVYESAQHGNAVLSVMAANMPGYFVGAAPEATYFLLKTEDTGGEFPIEEVNWIMGAEWADSIGVNIINASLGYTTFSDTLLNHRFAQLDGQTAIGSRGAAIAARKGMIICNSAGNSGDEPWRYIGVPSDAKGVIGVGALDSQTGNHAPFSSHGPTADGRIKPDLSAPGMNVVTAGSVGDELTVSAGTSIASPILAGSIAALWSDFPHLPAHQILEVLFENADQNEQPDNDRGYGMPDFVKAWLQLNHIAIASNQGLSGYDVETGQLTTLLFEARPKNGDEFVVKNILGQVCAQGQLTVSNGKMRVIRTAALAHLPHGHYVLWANGYPFGIGL